MIKLVGQKYIKIFYFTSFYIFVYSQIWLYQLMDIITSSATSQIEETKNWVPTPIFFFWFFFVPGPTHPNKLNQPKKGPLIFVIVFFFFWGSFRAFLF